MRNSPAIVRSSLLKLLDGVLMWAPCWRILHDRARFRDFRAEPKQAIAFLFAASIFLALLLKWGPPQSYLAPPPACPPPPSISFGGMGAIPSALEGTGQARPAAGAQSGGPITAPPCPPPRQPGATERVLKGIGWALADSERALDDLLRLLFPGLNPRITLPDLLPYGMLLFAIVIGGGVELVMRAARRVKPSLFDRLNEELPADSLSLTVAAIAYGLGLFLICLFFAYAGARQIVHGSVAMLAVALPFFAAGFIIMALTYLRWMPAWLADIHGVTVRRFFAIQLVACGPLVIVGLILSPLLLPG